MERTIGGGRGTVDGQEGMGRTIGGGVVRGQEGVERTIGGEGQKTEGERQLVGNIQLFRLIKLHVQCR